jgi:hypothetical protein
MRDTSGTADKQARGTTGAVRQFIGPRSARNAIDPDSVLARGRQLLDSLSDSKSNARNLPDLKFFFAEACRVYYTLSAVSRRKVLPHGTRLQLLQMLFPLRARIEKRLLEEFRRLPDGAQLWRTAVAKTFFGVSAKQGVSIRYPLATCVPTALCGGRCYGHDGRDRELHLIFRAALNGLVGSRYEESGPVERRAILKDLDRAITFGISKSLSDASNSAIDGFKREPRIRFSHIGDMAATPQFTNALAGAIRHKEPRVACIVYTRHPRAAELDPELLRVNFTLDSANDVRRRSAPSFARLVSSAWDGQVTADVAINFLEHHVEKNVAAIGTGFVCPVTVHHSDTPTCDSARCDRCFRKPDNSLAIGVEGIR